MVSQAIELLLKDPIITIYNNKPSMLGFPILRKHYIFNSGEYSTPRTKRNMRTDEPLSKFDFFLRGYELLAAGVRGGYNFHEQS